MMLSMYAKIFTSLWDGSLRGRSDEILVFVNLLTHANSSGEVDRHFKAIADETGLPIERVRSAITALESDDPESRSPLEKGKRVTRLDDHRDWGWKIINYDHYRGLVSDHERREKTKERTRKWRETKDLKRCDAMVTHGDACDAKQKQRKKQKYISTQPSSSGGGFKRPTAGELEFHASKIGLPMSQVAEFVTWYDGNGWMVKGDGGKMEKMKSWKGTMAGWKRRWEARRNGEGGRKTDDDRAFEMIFGPT